MTYFDFLERLDPSSGGLHRGCINIVPLGHEEVVCIGSEHDLLYRDVKFTIVSLKYFWMILSLFSQILMISMNSSCLKNCFRWNLCHFIEFINNIQMDIFSLVLLFMCYATGLSSLET